MYQFIRVLVPLFCLVLWLGEGLRSEPKARISRPERGQLVLRDRYGDPLPPGAIARLGTVRLRHPGPVETTVFTSDGKLLISAGLIEGGNDDFSEAIAIRLWDVKTYGLVGQLETPWVHNIQGGLSGFSGLPSVPVRTVRVAVSANSKTLAVRGPDSTIYLWNLATRTLRRRLPNTNRKEKVRCVALSPDGKTLASLRDAIEILDVGTGKRIRRFGKDPWGRSITFALDGKTLASVGRGLCIWDVSTGKIVRKFKGSANAWAALSPDGKMVAADEVLDTNTGRALVVNLFEVASGKKLRVLQVRKDIGDSRNEMSHGLAFSPDGKLLAAAVGDGVARVWEVSTGKLVHRFKGGHGYLPTVAFSSDGKILATGGWGRVVRLWTVTTGKEIHPFAAHRGYISSLVYSADGKTLVSGSMNGSARLWDAATGKTIRVFRGHEAGIGCLALLADGRSLVTAGSDGGVHRWDISTGKELARRAGRRGESLPVCISSDGLTLLVQTDEGSYHVRDGTTGKELRTFRWPENSECEYYPRAVLSPDGKVLAWSEEGEAIQLRDVATGKVLGRLEREDSIYYWWLCFSPDGKMLAAADTTEDKVYLWDVSTRKVLATLPCKVGISHGAAYSRDGRLLATAEEKGIIHVWEIASGKEVRQFHGPTGPDALGFSPDGRSLAAGCDDFAILIWDVAGLGRGQEKRKAARATVEELSARWSALAAADASLAFSALWRLVATPRETVSFLQRHLRPVVAADPARLRQLIAELDDPRYAVRIKATRHLQQLGELAELTLRRALQGKPDLELQLRLRKVLAAIDVQSRSPSTEELRWLRGTWVLEQVGSPKARQLLKKLARGASASWQTKAAQAACERLAKRPQ